MGAVATRNVELGQGKFSIKITDRERKLNINSARPELRDTSSSFMAIASTDVDIFLDSLVDWIDPGRSRVNGAESDDYLEKYLHIIVKMARLITSPS